MFHQASYLKQDMELAQLDIWPPDALKRLSGSWITTAEQVVAIAATDSGMSSLAAQTGLSAQVLAQFVDRTRQALPSAVREQLSKPADTSRFGTGAQQPGDKRK
jgi:hypothetical protein